MKCCLSTGLVVALAALAMYFEGSRLRAGFSEWLAAGALPAQPETITAIELAPNGNGGGIPALDAALALRAILRCEPKAVVFLDQVEPGESEALLLSKLSDAKMPVVFTGNGKLDPLPGVAISRELPSLPSTAAILPEGRPAGGGRKTPDGMVLIAARQGDRAVASSAWQFCMTVDGISAAGVSGRIPGVLSAGTVFAPVDSTGCARINPLAYRYVRHIAIDQLMLRTERSEQGAISIDLDALFRGRLIAIQNEGEYRAEGLAALRNGLAESVFSIKVEWLGLLVIATLPWWRGSRVNRALFALGVTCAWALMALAFYQEFRVVTPLSILLVLPLLALIPPPRKRRSNKVEQRELPA